MSVNIKNMDDYLTYLANIYQLNLEDIKKSGGREYYLVTIRKALLYHLYYLGYTYKQIANLMGYSNHTSVMHHVRQYHDWLKNNLYDAKQLLSTIENIYMKYLDLNK